MCVADAYRLFNEVCCIVHNSMITFHYSMLTYIMDLKCKVCTNQFHPNYHWYIIGGASGTDLDFDDAVTQELKDLKEKPTNRRFQSVESGAKNVVFIQCEAPVCPDDLVHYMLTRIKASGIPCTRYKILLSLVFIIILSRHCQRVLPITHICRAFQNDIRKCANEMLAPHFHIPDTTKQVKASYTAPWSYALFSIC